MTEPHASCSCSCGQRTLVARGDPIRVSMCHCFACQRRSGSTYGAQARLFPPPKVSVYEVRRHPWVSVHYDAEHWD